MSFKTYDTLFRRARTIESDSCSNVISLLPFYVEMCDYLLLVSFSFHQHVKLATTESEQLRISLF